jgi:Thioredoxin like C-terminal domain
MKGRRMKSSRLSSDIARPSISPDTAAFHAKEQSRYRSCLLLLRANSRSEPTAFLVQATGSILLPGIRLRGHGSACRFHARDAHLVLSPGAPEPIPFRVLLDGEAPGPSHGLDVDHDGNGLLRDGRLYQLVREHDAVRERALEITFLDPGAEAYAFTFG